VKRPSIITRLRECVPIYIPKEMFSKSRTQWKKYIWQYMCIDVQIKTHLQAYIMDRAIALTDMCNFLHTHTCMHEHTVHYMQLWICHVHSHEEIQTRTSHIDPSHISQLIANHSSLIQSKHLSFNQTAH